MSNKRQRQSRRQNIKKRRRVRSHKVVQGGAKKWWLGAGELKPTATKRTCWWCMAVHRCRRPHANKHPASTHACTPHHYTTQAKSHVAATVMCGRKHHDLCSAAVYVCSLFCCQTLAHGTRHTCVTLSPPPDSCVWLVVAVHAPMHQGGQTRMLHRQITMCAASNSTLQLAVVASLWHPCGTLGVGSLCFGTSTTCHATSIYHCHNTCHAMSPPHTSRVLLCCCHITHTNSPRQSASLTYTLLLLLLCPRSCHLPRPPANDSSRSRSKYSMLPLVVVVLHTSLARCGCTELSTDHSSRQQQIELISSTTALTMQPS